jgi:hypothetical protein
MRLKIFNQGETREESSITGTDPTFDLDRAKFRLEGLSHYASVSALLLNAALTLFNATPKKLDDRKQENAVKIAFVSLVTATVVLGSYTTMVFSLLSLYAKTFLGMGMDAEYVEFFNETLEIRKSAFLSFVGTVLSFNFAFVLCLYLSYEGQVRFWVTTITTVLIAIAAQNWFMIMKYASLALEEHY